MRTKKSPLIRHPYLPSQTKDLKAAAVCQCWTGPTHKSRHAARLLDHARTGPQMKVVGVGKHHARAGFSQAAAIDSLDRGRSADRHKKRGWHAAVRRCEHTRSRSAGARCRNNESKPCAQKMPSASRL